MAVQTISREQLKEILMKKPAGISNQQVIEGLRRRGYKVGDEETIPTEQQAPQQEEQGLLGKVVSGVKNFISGNVGQPGQQQEQSSPLGAQTAQAAELSQTQTAEPVTDPARVQALQRIYDQTTDPVKKKKIGELLNEARGTEDLTEVRVPAITLEDEEPITETQKNWVERMKDKFYVRAAAVDDILMATGTGQQSGAEGIFQVLGQGAGLFNDAVYETTVSSFRALPDFLEEDIKEKSGQLMTGLGLYAQYNPLVNNPITRQMAQNAQEYTREWEQRAPNAKRNAVATFNLVSAVGNATAIYKAGGYGVDKLKKLAEKGKNGIDSLYKVVWSNNDEVLAAKARAAGYVKQNVDDVASKADDISTRWAWNKQSRNEIKDLVNNAGDDVASAVDQGIDYRDAVFSSHANKKEIALMNEMSKYADDLSSGAKNVTHPSEVVGRTFVDETRALDSIGKQVGSQLDDVARNLPATKVDDAADIIFNRMQRVPGMEGLRMSSVKGKWVLDFSATSLADDTSTILDITTQFNKAVNKTLPQMHTYRQALANELKKFAADKTKDIVLPNEMLTDSIRGGMLDAIGSVSDDYVAKATEYAIIQQTLNPVRKTFNVVKDFSDDVFNVRSAQLMRRLNSNAGAQVQGMVEQVNVLANGYGVGSGVDIKYLQEFSNILEKYFDIAPSTSLAGQVKLGSGGVTESIKDVAVGVAKEIPLVEQTSSLLTNFMRTPESKQKALLQLINALMLK